MHTGVSSYRVVWYVCCERYTRVFVEASPEFPIHFLKIYSFSLMEPPAYRKYGKPCYRVSVHALIGFRESYAPALSEKCNSFLRLLKKKGCKEERMTKVVAYLLLADNVSRPLPCRLHHVSQPVIRTPNVFSAPRAILLAWFAHLSRSPRRSSPHFDAA